MADDSARVVAITNNLEATHLSMKRAAANIAGLLQAGRATCQEVRAYNLWALALYNEQRGMLETMRAAGQTGLPNLPPSPTLFTWKGVRGEDAWKIHCEGSSSSLSGLMKAAMKSDNAQPQYLSTNEIQIQTQDQFVFNPEAAPSFSTLYQVQQHQAQQAGLGIAPVALLVIATISILAISAAIVAISKYLETKEIQESNSNQVKLQADAFANYTAARLQCYADCMKTGKSAQECTDICKQLIHEPNIKTSFLGSNKWGTLQWVGFVTVLGLGSFAAYRIYQRHRAGKPLFELPDFEEHAA